MRAPLWLTPLIVLMLLAAACSVAESPTSPSATTGETTEVFTTTVPVNGSSSYAFTVTSAGLVDLTLVRVGAVSTPLTVNTTMGMGVGTPNGTDCDVTTAVMASPGLTSQLRIALTGGIFCARVYDVGYLMTPVSVALRIVHP